MKKNTEPTVLRGWVSRTLGALALTAALAAGPACGGIFGGPIPAGDPLGLVLADAKIVAVQDVASYLDAPELTGILLGGGMKPARSSGITWTTGRAAS